jgi:hypothetical protein
MRQKVCGECGKPARRLRKTRCDACYMRLYRNGEPEPGAVCAVCGERRRQVLAMAEVGEVAAVLCGNCSLVLVRTRPRIETLIDLVKRVDRERRGVPDRRRLVAPVPEERRAAYRRVADRAATPQPPPRADSFDPSVD